MGQFISLFYASCIAKSYRRRMQPGSRYLESTVEFLQSLVHHNVSRIVFPQQNSKYQPSQQKPSGFLLFIASSSTSQPVSWMNADGLQTNFHFNSSICVCFPLLTDGYLAHTMTHASSHLISSYRYAHILPNGTFPKMLVLGNPSFPAQIKIV